MLIMFNNFQDGAAKCLTNWTMLRLGIFYLFNICRVGPSKRFIEMNMFSRVECQAAYIFTHRKVNLKLCSTEEVLKMVMEIYLGTDLSSN